MSLLDEMEANSGRQNERKVRYDDWNGAMPHERYEGLISIDKYATSTSHKMAEFGESGRCSVRVRV